MLKISLLGEVQIEHAGLSLMGALPRKAQALLIYLVCAGTPQDRDLLANLLWDGRSQDDSRRNLRVTCPGCGRP